MNLKTENYTIETDAYGYRLTVTVPTNHAKSKTGLTSESTFHATLAQVAAKMMHHEIARADADSVAVLAEQVSLAAKRIADALEALK